MKTYQHTQRGAVILVAMAIAVVVAIIISLAVSRALLVAVPIFLLVGWLFGSLTIEVMNGELRWRFGPGLIRKEVSLADISSTQPVRTNVLEGWGIHFSRYGWLYNVSGHDAVAIALKNGKRFALGTDEPAALVAALGTGQP
jgi:hypothetical protein